MGAEASVFRGIDFDVRIEVLQVGASTGFGKAAADRVVIVRRGQVSARVGDAVDVLGEGGVHRFPLGAMHEYSAFGHGEAEVVVIEGDGFSESWTGKESQVAAVGEPDPSVLNVAIPPRGGGGFGLAREQLAQSLGARRVMEQVRQQAALAARPPPNPNSGNAIGTNLRPEIPGPEE